MDSVKIKVLLVEDMKIAQKVARMTLENLNCEIDTADTGAQALELINQKTYDIIFMDLGLDDIDGLTVTETIRKMEGINHHTPIVALTAHSASDEDMKAKCLQVGMDDFMEKPVKADSIQIMFNKYVYKN